jgi:PKD repeat protein
MRKNLLGAALLFSSVIYAQTAITVNNGDMPSLNDTIRYSTSATSVTTLINQTGANQTWNAANLVPNFQDIQRFRAPLSINPLYFTSFASSTYGTESTQGLNFGALVQGSDAFTFFRNSSGAYAVDGRGFSVQGIPLAQTWKDTVYRFPLNYGDVDSNSWVTNEVNALIATIRGVGKRVNTVDGWGTITTPYGTYDCIRVKSVVRTTDTIRTSLIPFPFPITTNYTEYKWIAKNQKIPILEIVVTTGGGGGGGGGGNQTTVRYRDLARPEVFLDLARFSANKTVFQVNSNTDTCILNDNSTRNPVSRTWTITPNTFQYTGGTNANSQRPKIFFTATGTYTVSLRVNYNAGSDDTTIVDYITVAEGPRANFVANRTGTNTTSIVEFTDSSEGDPQLWQWSFDPPTVSFVGGTSAMSQNPKVLFDAPGVYSVTLVVENGIGSDTKTRSNYIAVFNTGLNERMVLSGLKVYPNPAKDMIEFKLVSADAEVKIYDITGKLCMQGVVPSNTMDISSLKAGLYVMQIVDGATVSLGKFIKE